MNGINRRQAGVALLSCSALGARAQATRKYAVLSLVGEHMTVVSFKPQTGSHMDANEREVIALPDTSLDEALVLAIEKELLKAQPGSQPQLIVPGGPPHYANQTKFFDGEDFRPNAALDAAFKQLSATHLILVTRFRSPGGLRGVRTTSSGARTLEGLGFYLDAGWRETRGNLKYESSGLLAPYAHARFSLVDLTTRKLVRHEVSVASTVIDTPPGFRDPWQAVNTERKLQALQELLAAEAARIVPGLIS